MMMILVLVGFLFVTCISQEEQEDFPSSIMSAPMDKNEQDNLYAAIQGFVGSQWNGSDLYPDPCGWTPIEGVYCDYINAFWFVTVINIGPFYDNSLLCTETAKFTDHLFNLRQLKTFSLFKCFKTPTIIPNFNLSNSLESLEFRSNPGLIGPIPSTLGCLKKLQSLVLMDNSLTGELPTEIGNLVKLKRLVLAGNKFVGRIPETFGELTELLILDTRRNSLSGPLPHTIGNLSSLLKLDLSKNFLEGKIPEELGNLRNVTLLDFSSNRFSGGLVQEIMQMASLKVLVLSNNLIGGDLVIVDWKNLQNLEILDLSKTGMTGSIPDSVLELKSLRFLGLDNNNLTGRVPLGISALPCIGSVYINGNNFTGPLEFPARFYTKMGRRFGAWNNPNLCYRSELLSKNSPYGVKLCQEETFAIEQPTVKFRVENSDPVASYGVLSLGICSTFSIDCFGWRLVMQVFLLLFWFGI
ncbi:hypothetical protein ACFE04_005654 [Oxalis oulophora]